MSVCSDRSCASSMMITLYLRVRATTGRYWESALSTIASRSSMPSVMNLMYVVRARAVVETHAVAHLVAQHRAALLRHTLRDGDGGHSARLRNADDPLATNHMAL